MYSSHTFLFLPGRSIRSSCDVQRIMSVSRTSDKNLTAGTRCSAWRRTAVNAVAWAAIPPAMASITSSIARHLGCFPSENPTCEYPNASAICPSRIGIDRGRNRALTLVIFGAQAPENPNLQKRITCNKSA